MIGRLNHVAIAVPDLGAAAAQYRAMGVNVSEPQDLHEHEVTVVFVDLPNTKIELLHPLGDSLAIRKFLERNPSGGIHHICFEVDNLERSINTISTLGARILGAGTPSVGAHGNLVTFLHPKDFQGTLVELEQTS